jgi:hypothetical protein
VIARRALLAGAGAGLASAAWAGDPLPPPAGRAILRVEGRLGRRNGAEGAGFDLAMLDALPQGRFHGETPWTRGSIELTGPLASAVLDAVQASGSVLSVVALNEYKAEVPIADLRRWPVLLATRRDGVPMAVRDKGPIWLIYPMDREPSLRNETIYARSVWQIARLVIG